jgi:hypothetical protein
MSWGKNWLNLTGRILAECVRFAANGTPTYAQGNVFWDDDDKTLSLQTASSEVTLQIGQELQVRAVNKTGSDITNGTPVYISGQFGTRATMAPASAAVDNDAAHCIGVATHDVNNNEEGYITSFGLVRDVNTDTYAAGNLLLLQDVAGTLGTSAGTVEVHVCTVIVAHATEGVILVNPHH